jgi:hypothetical protein
MHSVIPGIPLVTFSILPKMDLGIVTNKKPIIFI